MRETNGMYPRKYHEEVKSYLEYIGYPDVLYALYEDELPTQEIAELIVMVAKHAHDEGLSVRRAALDIFGTTCLYYGYYKVMENTTIN